MIKINLKNLRIDSGLTQKEFAKLFNIPQPYVSRYERSIIELSYELIHKICKYFNVTADYLLGLTDY